MSSNIEVENTRALHIISTPKSGSTVMMRVLAQALGGETSIYSEPGVATFAHAHDPNWVPHLRQIDSNLETFQGVDQRIIEEIKKGNVVVKDMIHTVYNYLISGESDLPKNPSVIYILSSRSTFSISFFK